MGGEPFLEEKRGLKGFFMEPGVMNSFQGKKKKGGGGGGGRENYKEIRKQLQEK